MRAASASEWGRSQAVSPAWGLSLLRVSDSFISANTGYLLCA
ncbi:hypothetical protein [Bradyrhizobium sp. NP1]|nr:hypothetical protein [Bradyrhizobium sp. NP1]WJR80924.1 hypothetical protein QOU61_14545 [Bradyrhizobium sp. NP1]